MGGTLDSVGVVGGALGSLVVLGGTLEGVGSPGALKSPVVVSGTVEEVNGPGALKSVVVVGDALGSPIVLGGTPEVDVSGGALESVAVVGDALESVVVVGSPIEQIGLVGVEGTLERVAMSRCWNGAAYVPAAARRAGTTKVIVLRLGMLFVRTICKESGYRNEYGMCTRGSQ